MKSRPSWDKQNDYDYEQNWTKSNYLLLQKHLYTTDTYNTEHQKHQLFLSDIPRHTKCKVF